MSNRCPDCMKFVSLEQADPEVDNLEVDEAGTVTGEVRLVLTCADCGGEMKEVTLDFDVEADLDLSSHIDAHNAAGEAFTLEVEEDGIDATDRYQTTDRHGKPIKNFRYQRHFYGFELSVKVTCSCEREMEFDVSIAGDEQASAFEDLF